MNRKFEERKPTKVYDKSKENQAIIKALNMYGRVPEQWELLEEIEKLKNKINRAIEELELWTPEIEALKIERDYLLDILRGEDNE